MTSDSRSIPVRRPQSSRWGTIILATVVIAAAIALSGCSDEEEWVWTSERTGYRSDEYRDSSPIPVHREREGRGEETKSNG